MGGFGNVLFQILVYKIISKNNDSIKYVNVLTEDNFITKLLGWTIHERLYDDFIPKNRIANTGMINSLFILLVSVISKVTHTKNFLATFYSSSNKFERPYSRNIFGYFQEKDFLERHKNELLILGQELYKKYKKTDSSIVVHYRMGDSDWAREHDHYYNEVKKLVKLETEQVLIATDSPQDALSFFSECKNVQLTDSKNAMDDFIYMVNAKKLYCAPSTFSWWAAHSAQNINVVAPVFLFDTLGMYIDKQKLVVI